MSVIRIATILWLVCLTLPVSGQHPASVYGWHVLDRQEDGHFGISLSKAYALLKDKQSTPVIVAILDDGIDTTHEDLKEHIWKNTKEIPGNGIDDDGNGYIDDIHGWNFIGGKNNRNVILNLTYEEDLFYHHFKSKYEKAGFANSSPEEYRLWKQVKDTLAFQQRSAAYTLSILQGRIEKLGSSDSLLCTLLAKQEYTQQILAAFTPTDPGSSTAKAIVMSLFAQFEREAVTNKQLIAYSTAWYRHLGDKLVALGKKPEDLRGEIVQDDYYDINDRYYGNNNIAAGIPLHGTHVAGIIGAVRDNFAGIDGVCENILLMPVRIVSGGALFGKDIALGIRYAADNGARIINISLRQGFPLQQKQIDEAITYAASKNVLIVHAAGNDGWDLDRKNLYPKPGKRNKSNNWITVGASGDLSLGGLVAPFSNYGKNNVDVFAPGVAIYSCIPFSDQYREENGTSMATPIVSGLAAFILSYYPELTASQLKYIVENSVIKPAGTVTKPGTTENVDFSEICKSGGIVNAEMAIILAGKMNTGKKNTQK